MVKSQLFQRMISPSLKKSSYVLWVPAVGDRILVMTGRPGRIRQDISICMELPHHLSNRDNKVGLGVMIWFSWQTMRIEDLYAVLLITGLLGVGMDIILIQLSIRQSPWYHDRENHH
jgi:hypothetical protein